MQLALATDWRPSTQLTHRLVWTEDAELTCTTCELGVGDERCPAARAVEAFAFLYDREWEAAVRESRGESGLGFLDLTVLDSVGERVRVVFLSSAT